MRSDRRVVMVGPALSSRGGIASVCAEYERSGLMRRLGVSYLESFVSAGQWAKLRVALSAAWQFLWWLLTGRVALLHVHMATGASAWRKMVFCVLARMFRVPYVVHLHSGMFPEFFEHRCGPVGRMLMRRTLAGSGWIFVLSTERLQWMAKQGLDTARASVLPNMVEQPAFATYSAQARGLLFLGRLEEAKGMSTLLDAFAAVHAQHPSVRLMLGGEGDRARYESQAHRLGIGSAVQFLGWVDAQAKRKLMSQAAAFVLPSLYEGLPMGLLEAMSHGVPCVATPVGGVPDIIQHGHNGLLVPVHDSVGLAAALSQVLASAELRQKLSAAGRETVARAYCVSAVELHLRRVYETIAGARL